MERFSNGAILKWSNSQMEQFSNGAILKWSDSQMEQFSNGAIWGRHHQLDDSLVGQLTRLSPTVQHQKSSQLSKSNLPHVFSIRTSPLFPIPCIFGSIIWATTIESMISVQEQPQQSQTSIQVSLQCPSQPTLASLSCPQAPRWSTGPPCRLGEVASKLTSS